MYIYGKTGTILRNMSPKVSLFVSIYVCSLLSFWNIWNTELWLFLDRNQRRNTAGTRQSTSPPFFFSFLLLVTLQSWLCSFTKSGNRLASESCVVVRKPAACWARVQGRALTHGPGRPFLHPRSLLHQHGGK